MSGGTCSETASGFKCSCPPSFFGERCQHRARACEDYMKFEYDETDGTVLKNVTGSSGAIFEVLCSFSERFVRTLLLSYSFGNNSIYSTKPLSVDYPRNENTFNWEDYRLSKNKMMHLEKYAERAIISCNYNKYYMRTTVDYLRFGITAACNIFMLNGSCTCIPASQLVIKNTTYNKFTLTQGPSTMVHVSGVCSDEGVNTNLSFAYLVTISHWMATLNVLSPILVPLKSGSGRQKYNYNHDSLLHGLPSTAMVAKDDLTVRSGLLV